jgi:hypothetical protein
MTSSAHGAAGSWYAQVAAPPAAEELEPPAFAREATQPAPYGGGAGAPPIQLQDDSAAIHGGHGATAWPDRPDLEWTRTEVFADGGLTGRGIIAAGAVAVAVSSVLDLALTGGQVTFFFDLCFVVICLLTAMAVRRSDLFTAGVLPPLMFAAVIAVLSVCAPGAFDSTPGLGKVFLTGLADHAAGLVGGYAVALATIAARVGASAGPRRGQ